jgi:hypothetical protein
MSARQLVRTRWDKGQGDKRIARPWVPLVLGEDKLRKPSARVIILP